MDKGRVRNCRSPSSRTSSSITETMPSAERRSISVRAISSKRRSVDVSSANCTVTSTSFSGRASSTGRTKTVCETFQFAFANVRSEGSTATRPLGDASMSTTNSDTGGPVRLTTYDKGESTAPSTRFAWNPVSFHNAVPATVELPTVSSNGRTTESSGRMSSVVTTNASMGKPLKRVSLLIIAKSKVISPGHSAFSSSSVVTSTVCATAQFAVENVSTSNGVIAASAPPSSPTMPIETSVAGEPTSASEMVVRSPSSSTASP